jgi:hypothetical protein
MREMIIEKAKKKEELKTKKAPRQLKRDHFNGLITEVFTSISEKIEVREIKLIDTRVDKDGNITDVVYSKGWEVVGFYKEPKIHSHPKVRKHAKELLKKEKEFNNSLVEIAEIYAEEGKKFSTLNGLLYLLRIEKDIVTEEVVCTSEVELTLEEVQTYKSGKMAQEYQENLIQKASRLEKELIQALGGIEWKEFQIKGKEWKNAYIKGVALPEKNNGKKFFKFLMELKN